MVTATEGKFVRWLNKQYLDDGGRPCKYIKKLPDFRATANPANAGMPDFLIIMGGVHVWVEVKSCASKDQFAFSLMETAQWKEFARMTVTGGVKDLWIAAYMDGGTDLWFFRFEELYALYIVLYGKVASVKLRELRAVHASNGDPTALASVSRALRAGREVSQPQNLRLKRYPPRS